MTKVTFFDTYIVINEKKIDYNELYSLDVYKFADECSGDYDFDTPIDNVAFVFITVNVPVLAIKKFLLNTDNECTYIIDDNVSRTIYNVVKDLLDDRKIIVGKKTRFLYYKFLNKTQYLRALLKMLITTVYLGFGQICQKKVERKCKYNSMVCVIRSNAVSARIKNRDKYEVFDEKNIGRGSIYQYFTIKMRLKFLCRAFTESIKDLSKITKGYKKIGWESTSCLVTDFYAWRLPHIRMWGYMVESILAEKWAAGLISGNMIDGCAYMERKAAKYTGKKLIRYPHGVIGKIRKPQMENVECVYVWTKGAEKELNSFYNTSEYVFNEDVTREMLAFDCMKKTNEVNDMRYVYFTSGNIVDVDRAYINEIKKMLAKRNKRLYVKLHPGERRSSYDDIVTEDLFIKTIDEAVSGNVCIASYSSILLEALYNGGCAIQIVTNIYEQEYINLCPSLRDPRINVVYSTKELSDLLV